MENILKRNSTLLVFNSNGQVTILALLLLQFLAIIALIQISKNLQTIKKVKELSSEMLCHKYQVQLLKKYLKRINFINSQIYKINSLKIIPSAYVSSQAAITLLKIKQNKDFFSYMKKTYSYSRCPLLKASIFARNFPYGLIPKRGLFEMLDLEKRKWTIIYPLHLNLFIRGTFSLTSNFSGKLRTNFSEINQAQ
jgi:hypothetical protein